MLPGGGVGGSGGVSGGCGGVGAVVMVVALMSVVVVVVAAVFRSMCNLAPPILLKAKLLLLFVHMSINWSVAL